MTPLSWGRRSGGGVFHLSLLEEARG